MAEEDSLPAEEGTNLAVPGRNALDVGKSHEVQVCKPGLSLAVLI